MPNFAAYRARRSVRYGGMAALLAALLLLTWGARAGWTARQQDSLEAQRQAAAEDALDYAQQAFTDLGRALGREAEALAEEPMVVQGLRAQQRAAEEGAAEDDAGAGRSAEALMRHVTQRALPERTSVEVYDAAQRLIAWKGYSMPLSDTVAAASVLDAPPMAVAQDGTARYALASWQPVRDAGRVVGAVRVVRTVQFEAPVQNQYLGDYSLADEWAQATQRAVRVQWGRAAAEVPRDTAALAQPLRTADGRVLGRVAVAPPSAARLLQQGRQWFGDLMALWGTLLMMWGVLGLWMVYRRMSQAAEATVHTRLLRAAGGFALWTAAWWALRYGLLAIDVPARWQRAQAPLAPLFDPTHLASAVGGGLMRSIGDLLISGSFAFVFAIAFLNLAAQFRNKGSNLFQLRARLMEPSAEQPSRVRFVAVLAVSVSLLLGLAAMLAFAARRAVLDSTLDYFARTGLLPDVLVLIVFCGLLMLTIAVVLTTAGLAWVAAWLLMRYWPGPLSAAGWAVTVGAAVGGPLAVAYGALDMGALVGWPMAVAVLAVGGGIAGLGFVRRDGALELLSLRRLLPSVLLVALLLYPLFYRSMDVQRRARLVDAAASFGEGGDPRAQYSIRQVLEEAGSAEAVAALLAPPRDGALDSLASVRRRAALDSAAAEVLRGSLLRSLGTYRASLTFFDAGGQPAGSYAAASSSERRLAEASDAQEFGILQQMYAESRTRGPMVEQLTGRRDRDRFQYAGLYPIRPLGADEPDGWVLVRAEPQTLVPEADTPFPRALLPAGYYGDLYANLSLAEFRDGTLVRSLGRDFGRYRLAEPVQEALATQPQRWRAEEVKGRSFLTYYQRQAAEDAARPSAQGARPARASVTAVRVPAIVTFDHLYYILRLVVAGLCIGGPLYVLGLALRWRRGRLPAPRAHFRDKVLNAFLAVGGVTVVLVGLVGLRVLREENARATQGWLRQRLEQVEETLALEAQRDELPYRAARRIGIDSLAARVGLDLNLYEDARLVATSRPRLVRERLIDGRLPAEAYAALYYEGYRFTTTQERIGTFPYTVGFRALTDEQGRPRFVLSVPTLPEQERIEEEQSRTVAYLFGALLLLVVLVVATASLLAGALTRPIERLRAGLEAVGKGQFTRRLPVETSDEIGELVRTYNEMRDQLAESRRKLTQQERELAWREMARQVAHEIKNPLTPMKLSVQHLQRAYDRLEVPGGAMPDSAAPDGAPAGDGSGAAESEAGRFRSLFQRITGTLIEQIDALARIANEFHSFARLPTRVLEPLDLNAVVREAASLMQEEAGTEIALDLHPEPLVVEADQEELRRIYINLIKNAIQAIPEDRAGRVRVQTTQKTPQPPAEGGEAGEDADAGAPHGWAQSRVADNGAGVPADLRDKIFQPNFSTKNSGTGLGLAIVRKGVEEMNGTVGFETEEGAGTTFWIRLPLAEDGASGEA